MAPEVDHFLPSICDPRMTRSHHAEQRRLVGLGRFELPTSRLSSARSNQLSYKPQALKALTLPATRECRGSTDSSVMKKEKRRRRCPAISGLTGRHLFQSDPMSPRDA